jgi:hypothetical protein
MVWFLPWKIERCAEFHRYSPSSPFEQPGTPGPGAPAGTDVRVGDDFGDRQLFPADNWWNQDISNAPVDAMGADAGAAGGPTLHRKFGPGADLSRVRTNAGGPRTEQVR